MLVPFSLVSSTIFEDFRVLESELRLVIVIWQWIPPEFTQLRPYLLDVLEGLLLD
jgi:hypothetical protein